MMQTDFYYSLLLLSCLSLLLTCCNIKQETDDAVPTSDVQHADTLALDANEQERLRRAEDRLKRAELENDSAQAKLFKVKYLYELDALSCNETTVDDVKKAYEQLRDRAKDFVGRKVEKRFDAYRKLFNANKRDEVESFYLSGLLSTKQCQVIVDSYLKDWAGTWAHTDGKINFIAAFEYARDVLNNNYK